MVVGYQGPEEIMQRCQSMIMSYSRGRPRSSSVTLSLTDACYGVVRQGEQQLLISFSHFVSLAESCVAFWIVSSGRAPVC